MKYTTIALAMTAALLVGTNVASAGPCAAEIKALQESAAKTDAKNKPGNQATPIDSGSAKTEGTMQAGADKGAAADPKVSEASPKGSTGGGTRSASEMILKANAHDQRGEEAKCMESIKEARKLLDT